MERDAMRMLMDARPDELDLNAPIDAATRERELSRAQLGTPVAARPRRRVRPVWGLGLAGVAAAAVAAAVLVPTGGDHPRATPSDKSPQAIDGRQVLLTAADSAAHQPGASGSVWHVSQLGREYVRAGAPPNSYTVVSEERSDQWTSKNPGDPQVGRNQDLGAHPVTAADRAAWKKAGSPKSWLQKFPLANGKYKARALTSTPRKPSMSRMPVRNGEVYWLGRNVTMKQIAALPDDPKALRKSLLRWYQGHGTEAQGQKSSADEWLFDVTRGLVTDMPVTPKVRAAAFRLLAALPSVRSLGRVTDDQGRSGIAIGLTRPTSAGDVLQTRLIVDPSAGRGLGSEDVLVKPSANYPGVPAGSVLNSTTVTTAEWTSSIPK
ncbi:CU044_5270 family protein [Actinomadura rupiterrae]|uniref:CU044_5270 family protein n=1 Tax=Actinomadura rupiterrae TaxID=559627 RepID=UPI0020A5F118|nr:CU044_5270 family protein [Actinomadura rupiterrae]MCP2337731.1 hypothetical protein [Actinomadura rupiterrae]